MKPNSTHSAAKFRSVRSAHSNPRRLPTMKFTALFGIAGGAAALWLVALMAFAQEQRPLPPAGERPLGDERPSFGPGGGPPGGQQERKLIPQFDQDGDKRLNAAERKAARDFLAANGGARKGGPRGPGGPGGQHSEPAKPGRALTPAEVKNFPDAGLFDEMVLRTFFLEFDSSDWEKELAEFKNTDVEVPAKLTVDGKVLRDVGVRFRGMSSFMMVPEGSKRSLGLSIDYAHENQRLAGYRNLHLLNAHEDPSFLRSVLYNHIARTYLPAPKATFARVVINGECWGVYVCAQQFDKDFVADAFQSSKGTRWKVPGSPNGRGSLAYLGDDPAPYKRIYDMKSKDDGKAWAALIKLCKTLTETPPKQLEAALKPLLDVDGALKFLALENTFINNDGYWVRSSDYSLYLDTKGVMHLIPHDTNETFSQPGGPGAPGGGPGGPRPFAGKGPDEKGAPPFGGRGFGGPRVNGVELDPLVGANDASKPLLSKLLAVPAFRARYLALMRDMSERWLDWTKLGPLAQQYYELIAADVRLDTRKLESTAAFERSLTSNAASAAVTEAGPRGPRPTISLKDFADQRRAYLTKRLAELETVGR